MKNRPLVLTLVLFLVVVSQFSVATAAEESGLGPEALVQAEQLRDSASAGTGAYELLRSLTVEASLVSPALPAIGLVSSGAWRR